MGSKHQRQNPGIVGVAHAGALSGTGNPVEVNGIDAELVEHAPPSIEDARRAAEMLPGSVRLFGSVARGEATALSDIDLLVILDDVDYGQVSSMAGELRREAHTRTGLPLDVWVLDWPRWESNIVHPFTLEGRALTDGRWLRYVPPGADVKWEKKVAPNKVKINTLKNAINTLNGHLTAIVNELSRIDGNERLGIEQKNELFYWGSLAIRLGRMLAACHVVLEQTFKVIDHLAIVAHPKDDGKHHGLSGTYEAFGEELKRDFHNMLASANVDIGETLEGARKWLEWAEDWRSIGTYRPTKGLNEDRARQYGRVAADASDYLFAMVTAEIGDRTSLISQAVMELVVARIRAANVEWPPTDFDLQIAETAANANAENIRRILADGQWEWLYPGGEPPYGWVPPWESLYPS